MKPPVSDSSARSLLALGVDPSPEEPEAPFDREIAAASNPAPARQHEAPVEETSPGFDPCHPGPIETLPVGETSGDRIGHYELLYPLGEGGFSVVWLARQLKPIRREVALKVLKPGMDSREIIARFQAEQQSLALMEHPHIAAVLDAGATETGRLYFVMERVDGLPLTDYCDARELGIGERLTLFLKVCDAVQHAHLKGLIHRDLKPSNLLVAEVDGRSIPKVIDFGIAKALQGGAGGSCPSLTQTAEGFVVGTLQYMSPEQAGSRRDIDIRSDVYSLGTILYELLTGEPPLTVSPVEASSFDSVLRRIREEEIEKPSQRLSHDPTTIANPPCDTIHRHRFVTVAEHRDLTATRLSRTLQGELDWIVLRALEKERERRYQSVDELAADLRRHLSGEAVAAGPPSSWYRIRKAAARNRGLIAGATGVLAALCLGLTLATWQAIRATTAERIATSRLEMAEQARDAAEELLSQSVESIRRVVSSGRSGELQDSLFGARQYLESLPEDLANRTIEEYEIQLSLGLIAADAFEGNIESVVEHLDALTNLVVSLESVAPLPEPQQIAFVSALLIGAHTLAEAGDAEVATQMRHLARQRCEQWLRIDPEALWPLASLAHEASIAALEAALVTRRVSDAAPHLARLKLYELRLARAAPTSVEYFQTRGLTLFCEGFAKHHLGISQDRVIGTFENAAAAFRIAYETDENSAFREVFFRDLQLGAENAAGLRLLELGSYENDEAKVDRGRHLILNVYAQRLELAKRDPRRLEWWKDLAESARAMTRLARHGRSTEEAELLLAAAYETSRLVHERAAHHPPAAQAMALGLMEAIDYERSQGGGWTAETLASLARALDFWRLAALHRPEAYNLDKLLVELMIFVGTAFDESPDALHEIFEAELRSVCTAIEKSTTAKSFGTPGFSEFALETARHLLLLQCGSHAARDSSDTPSPPEPEAFAAALSFAQSIIEEAPSSASYANALITSLANEAQRRLQRHSAGERQAEAAALTLSFGPLIALTEERLLKAPHDFDALALAIAVRHLRFATEAHGGIEASEDSFRKLRSLHARVESLDVSSRSHLGDSLARRLAAERMSLLDSRTRRLAQAEHNEAALELIDEAIACRRANPPPHTWWNPYHLAYCLHERGHLLWRLGRRDEAAVAWAEALEHAEIANRREPEHPPITCLHLALRLSLLAVPGSERAREMKRTRLHDLASEQRSLLASTTSTTYLERVDASWARLAESRNDPSSEFHRRVLEGWREVRADLLSKNPPTTIRGMLRPIPDQGNL